MTMPFNSKIHLHWKVSTVLEGLRGARLRSDRGAIGCAPIGFQQAGSDSDARHLCAGTARGYIRTNSYGLSVRSRLGPIVCPFTLAARRKVLGACPSSRKFRNRGE